MFIRLILILLLLIFTVCSAEAHRSVNDAITWANQQIGGDDWNNYCWRFVRLTYDEGPVTGITSAIQAWNDDGNILGARKTDNNIPMGALVFFQATDSNGNYGHVGLSIGNNEMIHAWTTGVRQDSISFGGEYLGWRWPDSWTDDNPILSYLDLYAFTHKSDPICVSKVDNNFYASFRVKNNGDGPITIKKMAIAIYLKSGTFYKDCWLKGTATTIAGSGFFATGKQECKIPLRGEFEVVAKLFINNEWKHIDSKSFRVLREGECQNKTKIQPIISKLLLKNSQAFSGFISANNIVLGNVRFEDQDGTKLPLPDNAWIRIVPTANQIDGNYDGINCKVIPLSYGSNYSGSFGQLFCYARNQETLNYFNDHSEKFQIIIYEQTQNQNEDGWALWNRDEFAYCGYSSTGEPDVNIQPYGAWSTHTCVYNGPSVTESGGNDRDALTIPNGGETWTYGESRTIQWMTQYIGGSTVDLYVLHDNPTGLLDKNDPDIGYKINRKQWYRFAHSVSNTGSYTLDPQQLNGLGDAYMILIVSENDNSKFDLSDATFTLSN